MRCDIVICSQNIELTSARKLSLRINACLLSELSREMKLDRFEKTYNRFRTASTICMSEEESNVVKCSIELYRCRENECSIRRDVNPITWISRSFRLLSDDDAVDDPVVDDDDASSIGRLH